MSEFIFNRNYKDLDQVAGFLPAFRARLAELEAAGKYRYNDDFKGHVPGIEGPDEDTAIYLLQGLDHALKVRERAEQAIADGYRPIKSVERITRFSGVIVYDDEKRTRGPEWQEWQGARLIPETNENFNPGEICTVLPARKRTNGTRVNGRKVLVKP
jgi:hypothetical protein